MPIVLTGIAISVFFVFANPIFQNISTMQSLGTSYNEALNNAEALEKERDKLTAKYNAMSPENLARIQKLLPENVDNIRLILEIEQVASPYGMVLKDVKYNAATSTTATTNGTAVLPGGGASKAAPKDYGIFDLEFSTSGSYDNFVNFTKDLEKNLRIVDISSVSFSSDAGAGLIIKTLGPEIYKYDFKIKTYWLKD
jgi:Tfp pilus assembly protein PilO